jgi:hypothetical protein
MSSKEPVRLVMALGVHGAFALASIVCLGLGSAFLLGSSASAKPSDTIAATTNERGLANPGNDEALDALAEEIEAKCTLDDLFGLSGRHCQPYDEVKRTAKLSPKGFATMMNWLDDDSEMIRQAGLNGLWGFDVKSHSSCTDAGRVEAALGRETNRWNAYSLAAHWAYFAAACPDADAHMQTFVQSSSYKLIEGRRAFFQHLANPVLARPGWFETAKAVAMNDPDAGMRKSAATPLTRMPQAQAMPVLRTMLKDKDADVVASAASTLAMWHDDASYEEIVEAAMADLSSKGVHTTLLHALAEYVGRKYTKVDKAPAFAVAESYLQSEAYPFARKAALDVLRAGDAPKWKQTATSLAASKAAEDKEVAQYARELLDKEKEKEKKEKVTLDRK